jgi:transposase-like protein
MLTVGKDAAGVEQLLIEGGLSCPDCQDGLAPWGWAAVRQVSGPGRAGRVVRPRRSRCTGCRVTHVLLSADLLARRADDAAVVGRALALAARGHGYRRIAAALGIAEDTVRGWLRRFASAAGRVREFFTRLACALSPDPVPLEPAGSPAADAVVAIAAAADAAWSRWPQMRAVSAWELAAVVTSGTLMAPVITFRPFNTDSSPLAMA